MGCVSSPTYPGRSVLPEQQARDRIRIVVVDDHPVFRMGMTALLNSLEALEVVAEAGSVAEAIDCVATCRPDVVVMDLQLPDGSGVTATRNILTVDPTIGVLVVTMFADDDAVFAAMRAGARGYLVKGAGQEEIERAVRAVAAGEAILGPTVAQRAMAMFTVRGTASAFPSLTQREQEVLDLLARGLDNHAIGNRLGINEKTIRNHVSNVFTKLQVTDRSQAIVKAREAGLGREPE
ncbi:MAG TPA: response regulator transcription factor [Acidimicrobiales bacterium]|nr:response regulator transcription factor [Acidimicrobiales bacterium]